jgi:hypothetical protein
MLSEYAEYKNSILFVYDSSQALVGMNPIKAYRLAEKAV